MSKDDDDADFGICDQCGCELLDEVESIEGICDACSGNLKQDDDDEL